MKSSATILTYSRHPHSFDFLERAAKHQFQQTEWVLHLHQPDKRRALTKLDETMTFSLHESTHGSTLRLGHCRQSFSICPVTYLKLCDVALSVDLWRLGHNRNPCKVAAAVRLKLGFWSRVHRSNPNPASPVASLSLANTHSDPHEIQRALEMYRNVWKSFLPWNF